MSALSRCDDCLAQVEPMDWWSHREWHKRQEDALDEMQTSIGNVGQCDCDNTRPDVTELERQMQDVFNWIENEIFPRLEKLEPKAQVTEDTT